MARDKLPITIERGRPPELETNLKNLSPDEYKAAWKQWIQTHGDDATQWDEFLKEYGVVYDKGSKIKPAKRGKISTKPGTFTGMMETSGDTAVRLRKNRETILNYIFGGDVTDITTESAKTKLPGGRKLTAHHIRGLAEDAPWVDNILKKLSYGEGTPQFRKGLEMLETSRYYMNMRGLSGRGGTTLQNLSMLRTSWLADPKIRNDPTSPHLRLHRMLDEMNITSEVGRTGESALNPGSQMYHPEDAHLDRKLRRKIPTSEGITYQGRHMSTFDFIDQLPTGDTDVFSYTGVRDRFGPEYATGQERFWTGRRIRDVEGLNWYSSWADHIELTDPGRVRAESSIRAASKGLENVGRSGLIDRGLIPDPAAIPNKPQIPSMDKAKFAALEIGDQTHYLSHVHFNNPDIDIDQLAKNLDYKPTPAQIEVLLAENKVLQRGLEGAKFTGAVDVKALRRLAAGSAIAGLTGLSVFGTGASAVETTARYQIAHHTGDWADWGQAALSNFSLGNDLASYTGAWALPGALLSTAADGINWMIDDLRSEESWLKGIDWEAVGRASSSLYGAL